VEHVSVTATEDGIATCEVRTNDSADLREPLGQRITQNGWPLRRLDLRRVTLEDRFVQAVTRDSLTEAEREAV
jgi:ABC-2 type transport system ATP-binding protein